MQHSLGRTCETTWPAKFPWPPINSFTTADENHSLSGTVVRVFNLTLRRSGEDTITTKNAVGSTTKSVTVGNRGGYLGGKKSKDVLYKATGIEVTLNDMFSVGFLDDIGGYFQTFLGKSIDEEVDFATRGDRHTFTFMVS